MKIGATTTMFEIALLCRTYGVTRRMFVINPDGTCKAILLTADRVIEGTSRPNAQLPEADALDDAFARLKHQLARDINLDGIATGASLKWAL